MFFHQSEIDVEAGDEDNGGDGEQRIQIIGDRADEQGQPVGPFHYACYSSSPGGDRSDHTDRSSCGVDEIGKLCAGHIVLVCNRTHNASDGQTVKIIIHKDQRTQCEGRQKGSPAGSDLFLCPFSVGSGAAGFVHEDDDGSQNDQEDQDPHMPAVGQRSDESVAEHGRICGYDVEIGDKECRRHDSDEQGTVDFFGDQRKDDRYQRRYQGPESCIHNIFPPVIGFLQTDKRKSHGTCNVHDRSNPFHKR